MAIIESAVEKRAGARDEKLAVLWSSVASMGVWTLRKKGTTRIVAALAANKTSRGKCLWQIGNLSYATDPDKRLCWWDGREFIRHRGRCVVLQVKKKKKKILPLASLTPRPICCCPFHEGINRVTCKTLFPTKFFLFPRTSYEYLSQTKESTFKWASCILMKIHRFHGPRHRGIYDWNIRVSIYFHEIQLPRSKLPRDLNIIKTIGIRGSVFSKLKGFQQ